MRMYHGLCRDVSLLISEGHSDAMIYPIAKVWNEARIVRQREMDRVSRDALVMQAAMMTVWPGGKKAYSAFKKLLKDLDCD